MKKPPVDVCLQHVFRHYKGDLYRLLFTAWESTNGRPRERLCVYVSMVRGHINVRRYDEFFEPVVWPDGVERPRFARVEGE